MMRTRQGTSPPIVAALAATLLLLAPAGATAAGGEGGIVAHQLRGGGVPAWSAAQMRAAPQRDLLLPPDAPSGVGASRGTGRDGPPLAIPGRPPRGDFASRARAGSSAFGPFRSAAVADPTAWPNSAWGKVFGRIRGVGSFTCSATVVPARNSSVLFTAGHCVKEPGGRWVKSLTFVPAYEYGARPFGRWTAKAVFARKQWARRGNSNFDYASVRLRPNNGRRVERVVGSLGFAVNQPKRNTYRAVGYPFNRANAEAMWNCISEFGGGDPFYRPPGPRAIGIGCDMLGGASGGGWQIPGDFLASVTSFGYQNRPDQLYGPRLNSRAQKLRRAAAGR